MQDSEPVQNEVPKNSTTVNINENQEELSMGPWNIPKYVVKKKKLATTRGNGKRNVNMSHMENSVEPKVRNVMESKVGTQDTQFTDDDATQADNGNGTSVEEIPKSKPTIQNRIRNSQGGRNPQSKPKGKPTIKNGKGPTLKEKNVDHGETSAGPTMRKAPSSKITVSGKENVPTMEQQQVLTDAKKQEEAILAYMRAMYQTHGVNLLNKFFFRNEDSIRTALGYVDENDKHRAMVLQKKVSIEGSGTSSAWWTAY